MFGQVALLRELLGAVLGVTHEGSFLRVGSQVVHEVVSFEERLAAPLTSLQKFADEDSLLSVRVRVHELVDSELLGLRDVIQQLPVAVADEILWEDPMNVLDIGYLRWYHQSGVYVSNVLVSALTHLFVAYLTVLRSFACSSNRG